MIYAIPLVLSITLALILVAFGSLLLLVYKYQNISQLRIPFKLLFQEQRW